MKSEMKEQFDKRLVEKIKDSFNNYEEPFDPKQWEKFSDEYFNKKKPKPLWIWATFISGIAASLVIGFLMWPSVVDTVQEDYVSYDQELPSGKITESGPLSKSDKGGDIQEKENQLLGSNTKKATSTASTQDNLATDDPSSLAIASANFNEQIKAELAAAREEESIVPALGMLDLGVTKKLEMSEMLDRSAIPANVQETPSLQLSLVLGKEQQKGAEQLKEEDALKIINTWAMAESPSIIEKKKGDRGVKWGLVMAPQATSNTNVGLNLGGGVMSEISLTKRLKLDVGVTFARQSLVPGQAQNVAMVMNRTPGNTTADQLQYSPVNNANRTSAFMGANMISPVSPTYELNFANLDIPINLKYRIIDNPQSGLYLISGLSSMIYLSQSTSETYNISYIGIAQSNAFSSNQVQTLTTEITPQEGENTVDLGRMLNLSFGYEYKLTNGTFLSVEPFYKLPIGNMTFVDQQFSIGGVNLRMNFQFKK